MNKDDKCRAVHDIMIMTQCTSLAALVRWMQERGVSITYHGLRRWMSRDDHPYSIMFSHLLSEAGANDTAKRSRSKRQ